jgi:hypothetical protein
MAGTVERMIFHPSLTRFATSFPLVAVMAHATLWVLQAFRIC